NIVGAGAADTVTIDTRLILPGGQITYDGMGQGSLAFRSAPSDRIVRTSTAAGQTTLVVGTTGGVQTFVYQNLNAAPRGLPPSSGGALAVIEGGLTAVGQVTLSNTGPLETLPTLFLGVLDGEQTTAIGQADPDSPGAAPDDGSEVTGLIDRLIETGTG